MKQNMYQRLVFLLFFVFSSFIIADTRIESQTIIESIKDGEAVQFQNITITGDLDFADLCDKDSAPKREKPIQNNKIIKPEVFMRNF